MMKWHFELGLLLQMAGVTKLGLRLGQQEFFGLRVVRRMAGDATDIVLGVYRVNGIHMLRATRVATQTAGVDFFRGSILEYEYLGLVAAARHVVGSRTVATFATLMGRSAFRIQRRLPVRRLLPAIVDFLMTGLAGL